MKKKRFTASPGFALPALPSLSQNFLVDPRVRADILARFAVQASDRVVEIGPGHGELTLEVAGRARQLVAIELDRGLAARLAEALRGFPTAEVRHEDALQVTLSEIAAGGRLRVLANLPYRISSPFVLMLADAAACVQDALVLVQREFAERLTAAPGTRAYGSLTVLVQTRLSVDVLRLVAPSAFRPRPSVTSALVRLVPLPRPLSAAGDLPALKRLLRAAFSGRRKMLSTALAHGLELDRRTVARILEEHGHPRGCRAEELPPEAWVALARHPGLGTPGGAHPAAISPR